jgi:hypothetical protein
MEFQAGVEVWEISDLIEILNQYRILQEEPQRDLVTALWERQLDLVQFVRMAINISKI